MEIPYATLFDYCSSCESKVCKESERFCYGIKGWSTVAVTKLSDVLIANPPPFIDDFLGTNCLLVPIPSSSLYNPKSLWPALEITKLLRDLDFGNIAFTLLERHKAIIKSSAFKKGEDRAAVLEHVQSIRAKEYLIPDGIDTITLIDDVLTLGRTSAGCSFIAQGAHNHLNLKVLTVVGTQLEEIHKMYNPHRGMLHFNIGAMTVRRD